MICTAHPIFFRW